MRTNTIALLCALVLGCANEDWISYEECVLKNYELAVSTRVPEHREFYLQRANYCLEMARIHESQRAAMRAAIAGAAAQSFLDQQQPSPAPANDSRLCTIHGRIVLCP